MTPIWQRRRMLAEIADAGMLLLFLLQQHGKYAGTPRPVLAIPFSRNVMFFRTFSEVTEYDYI